MIQKVIIPIVITHSLFSVVYLSFNKSKYNIYLIGIFLSMILFHLGGILNPKLDGKGFVFPFLNPSYVLVFGPLLYFYTLSVIRETATIKKYWWLFLVPFFIYNLAFSFIFQPPPPPAFINAMEVRPAVPVHMKAFHILIFLSFLVYPILIYRTIKRNSLKLGSFYSFRSESTSLKWVVVISVVCSLLFL